MRTLVAGIVGGAVVFIWGFVSHPLLGLTEQTIKPLPNEATMSPAVAGLDGPGIYLVPSFSHEELKDPEKKKAHLEKAGTGPNALIVRMPDNLKEMDFTQFGYSFGIDVLAALIAALFIGASTSMAGVLPRAIAGGGLGVFAWCSSNAQYWVWLHFPWEFERAELINSVVAWSAACLVMALILKQKKPAAPAKPA
jgi:hypothetical protein